MDAQQYGALSNVALQRDGAFVWQPGGGQHRGEAASRMSGQLPELRGERSRRHNGPNPRHHQGDRGQRAAAQLPEARRGP